MEVTNQAQLLFHGVDFPVINMNSNGPLLSDDLIIDIKPKVFYPKDQPNIFKIVQEVSLKNENAFELIIIAVGTFELNSEVDSKVKNNFINLNAPAIMFPYIRSFISTLTSNIGNITGTLIIPTQFFNGELEELIEKEDKQK